jgi:hypothetical protein
MSARQQAPMMTSADFQCTRVYRVFIKAAPERFWEAITTPEFTQPLETGQPLGLRAE